MNKIKAMIIFRTLKKLYKYDENKKTKLLQLFYNNCNDMIMIMLRKGYGDC